MSFAAEATKKNFKINLVLKIGSDWYSIHQVDSDSGNLMATGSGVPSDNVGLIRSARINPLSVDVRSVRTTISTIGFELLDKNEIVTNAIGVNASNYLNEPVLLYVGFITSTFDFASYLLISETVIKSIKKAENKYVFNATEITDELKASMYDTFDTLDGGINAVATTLTLNDASAFPSSGHIKIGEEFIQYTGKTGNILENLVRADENSVADEHDDGDEVHFYYETLDTNPITLLLQLMVSPGGGGVYDVLADGLGISQDKIDIAEFESIRDDFFSIDQFKFFLGEVGEGLQFLENELLLPNNLRFIPKNGKISVSILDQVDLSEVVPVINEDTIVRLPEWAINSDKIVNKIIFKYNYSVGQDRYSRQAEFTNQESINTYGEKRALELKFKGIQEALSGNSIATNRANRLLERLSTPRAEIKVDTHFDQVVRDIGENVNIEHRYIPSQGGGLGISEQLEVLSKAVDFNTGRVKFKLQFTSFSGLRLGLIGVSPTISSITSQSITDIGVGQGACLRIGQCYRLYSPVLNAFLPDAPRCVTDISGDTITWDSDWDTPLNTSYIFRLADYDAQTSAATSLYAFTSPASDVFDDGVQAYQIIF